MGDAHAHVPLGEDDPVGADAVEDLPMRPRDRLGDDLRDLEVDEHRGREDARLHVGADGDDRGPKLRGAELAHRLRVGRVGLDDVGEDGGVILHALRIGIDAQHLVAERDELARERSTEAPEPADEELPARHQPMIGLASA